MARMAHDKQDAREAAHSLINLDQRAHSRRLKELAEDYIDKEYAEVTAGGGAFNARSTATDAYNYANATLYGPQLEQSDDPPAIAT